MGVSGPKAWMESFVKLQVRATYLPPLLDEASNKWKLGFREGVATTTPSVSLLAPYSSATVPLTPDHHHLSTSPCSQSFFFWPPAPMLFFQNSSFHWVNLFPSYPSLNFKVCPKSTEVLLFFSLDSSLRESLYNQMITLGLYSL